MSEKDNNKKFLQRQNIVLIESSITILMKFGSLIWPIRLIIRLHTTKDTDIFSLKIDNFSKYLWSIPLNIRYSQTITQEFSNNLTTSKGKPHKIE